jgi:hypothetical protein
MVSDETIRAVEALEEADRARRKAELEAEYRVRARLIYSGTGDLEIDPDAKVSHADFGAWVQAWVWVGD